MSVWHTRIVSNGIKSTLFRLLFAKDFRHLTGVFYWEKVLPFFLTHEEGNKFTLGKRKRDGKKSIHARRSPAKLGITGNTSMEYLIKWSVSFCSIRPPDRLLPLFPPSFSRVESPFKQFYCSESEESSLKRSLISSNAPQWQNKNSNELLKYDFSRESIDSVY